MRLEAGEGAGRTAWHLFDIPTMWTLVENQRTDNHWKLVNGWRMAYELTSTHLTRLKTYRDNLATAWPPDRSPASAAYCARLDYLIQHVQQAHDVAVANFTTLSVVTTAIAGARAELQKIYDEYQATRQTMAPHERRFKDPNAPVPPNLDFQNLPGTRRDIEELNARARTLMSGLADTLAEASIQIKQPPPYTPSQAPADPDGSVVSYGANSTIGLPIPPIVPVPIPTQDTQTLTSATNSARQIFPATPSPEFPVGPILSGAGTASPLLPPSSTTGPVTGVGSSPVATPTFPPTLGPRGSTSPPARTSPLTPTPSPANGSSTSNAVQSRAMPASGLIGGTPIGTLGQSTASTSAPQRINPVGGVIGGHQQVPTQANSPHSPRSTPSYRDRRSEQHWDPYSPWETAIGVNQILLPPREPNPIDPGPTIGNRR